MPADTPPAMPPPAIVQAPEDSANAAPIVALESNGYSYQIVGASMLESEQLRQILTEAVDPPAALLGINLALQQEYSDATRAVITQRSGNTVVIRISPRLQATPEGTEGIGLNYSGMLSEQAVVDLTTIRPQAPQSTQMIQADTSAGAVTPIVAMESNGYTYEIFGQPLLSADKLRQTLAEATGPSDAIARLNEAIVEADLALAGAVAERSGVSAPRNLLLQWVAAFEVRSQLEPFAQGTNDVNLKLSPVLNETMLAQAYAASDRDRKRVRIRLLKQPVAKLDAPEQLMPFFQDVTDVNLSLSTLLSNSALASAYSARQGARTQMSFTAIPGSEAVRMSVDELPIHGAKPWDASVSLGNLGNRYAGRWQAGTSVAYRPGYGSEITANYTQGVPSLDSASAGTFYRSGGTGVSAVTPWGIYGINYSQTNYHTAKSTTPVFAELQEQGAIKSWSLSGEQILHSTETTRWTASEGLAYVDDVASIDVLYLGTFYPNVPLHDENFTFLSAGVSVNSKAYAMGHAAALSGSFKLAKGLSGQVGSFQYSAAHLADPEFFLAQGSIGYDQTLPAGMKFGATLSTQWTADVLPQSRQLVVGGFGNLTAWLPGIASGDRGGQFRATLSSPAIKDGAGTFSLSLFYEAGRVTTLNVGNTSPTQSLSDIGIALVGDTPHLQYILGYAEPLATNNTDEALRDLLRAHTFFNLTGRW